MLLPLVYLLLHVTSTCSPACFSVLVQETMRYNTLLRVISRSLERLQNALLGLEIMTPELETVSEDVFMNRVPQAWSAVTYPSLRALPSWLRDLQKRIAFLHSWQQNGAPASYWLPGLYFPQAFLTAVMQDFARVTSNPIDAVYLHPKVCDEYFGEQLPSSPPGSARGQTLLYNAPTGSSSFRLKSAKASSTLEPTAKDSRRQLWRNVYEGVYVHGLYLQGATWDRNAHTLAAPAPKQMYASLPVVLLEPRSNRKPYGVAMYRCPLYKTPARAGTLSTTGRSTNFIMWLDLPSGKPSILRRRLVSELDAPPLYGEEEEAQPVKEDELLPSASGKDAGAKAQASVVLDCEAWIRAGVAALCEPPEL